MKKDEARRRIKAQKSLLDAAERATAARRVFEVLEQTAAFLMSDNILMYHSLPDELSTLEFIDKWSKKKHFFLPRVNGVNLEILPYDRSSLRLGAFHIEEPQGDEVCSIDDVELVIVPGVAYDRACNRVGRGKGFYDRYLSQFSGCTIGVVYSDYILPEVPRGRFDVSVDILLTEKGVKITKDGKKNRK